jgi:hypothetical protein
VTAYGEKALRSEGDRLRFITAKGSRHNNLLASSYRMGQLVGGAEITEERAWSVLMAAGDALGLPASNVRRHVERGIEAGRLNMRSAPRTGPVLRNRTDAIMQSIDLWDAMTEAPWSGAAGARDLKLLAAFLLKAIEIGKVEFTFSARQWSEASGISKTVVARVCMTLQPWIRCMEKGSQVTGKTTLWKLGVAPVREKRDIHSSPVGMASAMSQFSRLAGPGGCADPASDLYQARPGLWRFHSMLDPDGPDMTVASIRAITGLHPATIREYLKVSARWGLVERLDTFTWRATGADIDPEIIELTPAYGAARAEFHRMDRINYLRPTVDLDTGEIFNQVIWSKRPVERIKPAGTQPRSEPVAPDRTWFLRSGDNEAARGAAILNPPLEGSP